MHKSRFCSVCSARYEILVHKTQILQLDQFTVKLSLCDSYLLLFSQQARSKNTKANNETDNRIRQRRRRQKLTTKHARSV